LVESVVISHKAEEPQIPTVELIVPTDQNNSVDLTQIDFNCSANDTNRDLSNLTLYHNMNGSWIADATTPVFGRNGSVVFSRNISDYIQNGTFKDTTITWNCLARDSLNQSNWSSANYTFSSWDRGTYDNLTLNTSDNFIGLASNDSSQYENRSGEYNSTIFNAGFVARWNNISWDENVDHSKSNISVYVRSCDDAACDTEAFIEYGINSTTNLTLTANTS